MTKGPSFLLLHSSLWVGLLIELYALPGFLSAFRPAILAMLLIYWMLEFPNRVGFFLAFVYGVIHDLSTLSILGEHAFRYAFIAFVVLRFRARLRFFPVWQQALAVMLILGIDQFVVVLLNAIFDMPLLSWSLLLTPLISMLLWPWLYVLMDSIRMRLRERSKF